jgi:two-component system, OmpR family, alkaline phosphatase synthesis response regulator PhoP
MEKRILLVAMESDVVESFPITLTLAGHSVLLADRGLEGIRQARESLPDLVLVDATLPDMDGATLIDILRRLPSTGDLRTMLLKPRTVRASTSGDAERTAVGGSDLLAQVALALALCQEFPTVDLETKSKEEECV